MRCVCGNQLFDGLGVGGLADYHELCKCDDGSSVTSMTVGIGAICDEGGSAIVAADRQATGTRIQSDGTVPKIVQINDIVAMVISSNENEAPTVLTESMQDVEDDLLLEQIAEQMRSTYFQILHQKREETVRSIIGEGYEKLQELLVKADEASAIRRVWESIAGMTMPTEVIIVGKSKRGMFAKRVIGQDGNYSPYNHSHVAIGSGAPVASAVMARHGLSERTPIDEAILVVHEAKIASEESVGVGRSGDMLLLRAGMSPHWVDLAKLDQIVNAERKRFPSLKSKRRVTDLVAD